jgi:hypothetical protein
MLRNIGAPCLLHQSCCSSFPLKTILDGDGIGLPRSVTSAGEFCGPIGPDCTGVINPAPACFREKFHDVFLEDNRWLISALLSTRNANTWNPFAFEWILFSR